jgi:hypothetical protein
MLERPQKTTISDFDRQDHRQQWSQAKSNVHDISLQPLTGY